MRACAPLLVGCMTSVQWVADYVWAECCVRVVGVDVERVMSYREAVWGGSSQGLCGGRRGEVVVGPRSGCG